jgi:DNA (cytosine-5)-methyltransferase 1
LYNHIDLFSGIGGFALAARWAGIETIQFVEIDKFCQKVLRKNFKGVPIHDDIKTFKWAGERPFILTGGFPCQPFSCAGKRRGKEDDRAIWPEMLRVISEARPTWVIGENVAGIINMELDQCLFDLEGLQYETQTFIIPACAVNAPHRRDRVWIVAFNTEHPGSGIGLRTNGNWQKETEKWRGKQGVEFGQTDCHAPDTDRFNGDDAGYGSSEASQFKTPEILRCNSANAGGIRAEPGHEATRGILPISRSGHWQEPWLEVATRLCRVDDGVSDRVHRLKALGNAIVPQVAYQIMKAMLETEYRVI